MKTINQQKWYKPREIARLGMIKNSTGGDNEDGNYNFVLEQIKSGRLRAHNYSTGKKLKFYMVSEQEIARYHKSLTKLEG